MRQLIQQYDKNYGNAAISDAFTSSACTYSVVGRVKLRFTCIGLDIGAIFAASVNCTTAVTF